MSSTSSSKLGLFLLTSIYGTFRAVCNSSTLMSLHCYSCVFALSVCTFFIQSAFSLKSFSSLHIVSQNLSMSFIAAVAFTVAFSFSIFLYNFFASFLKLNSGDKVFDVSHIFIFFGL